MMNKLLIPLDKANHFIYGFIIFMIAQFMFNDWVSFGVVLFVALLKEVRDEIIYKGFDYKDLIATIIPSLIIILLR